LESKEVSEEPLDVLIPSCYDKGDDFVDNIDEFMHVGKHKWDVIRYDGDPIYDLEGHFQKLPLQLSYEVTTNFDIWKQGDDVVADDFQAPKGDLALCSHDDFRSYLQDQSSKPYSISRQNCSISKLQSANNRPRVNHTTYHTQQGLRITSEVSDHQFSYHVGDWV
jgi:hypothetical protein